MQEQAKNQIEQIRKIGDKIQDQARVQLTRAADEGKKILTAMGADLDADTVTVTALLQDIRKQNDSLGDLLKSLQTATYDIRYRTVWNARMMTSYAKSETAKFIHAEVRPRVEEYRGVVTTQLEGLKEKSGLKTSQVQ